MGKFFLLVCLELIRRWYLLALIALLFMVAYFWVEIEPSVTYGFGSGIVHGFFGVHNWILSFFTERVAQAPRTTSVYLIGFVVGLLIVPWLLNLLFEIVGQFIHYKLRQ